MNEKPSILLVEDDDFAADIATEMLSSDYIVQHVANGEAALESVAVQVPDLVLLDVSMPGMSGYEVCRTLRDDSAFDGLPVIFLSGLVSEEERIAGYEAGGDDYLTKPVAVKELRSKVRKALDHYAERQHLKADVSNAFSTAMTAMSSAAEVGTVLQFLRASFNCPSYESLCHELLNTLRTYGLEASVQIRGRQGMVCMSPEGPCSPLEESILSNMARQGRLFEFGQRLSCSYDHITIIVKNAPRDEADHYGRVKDNLALLAEGADARIVALDSSISMAKQHAVLTKLIASTREALQDIENHHHRQRKEGDQILQDFRSQLDKMLLSLGLTQSQEEELLDRLQQTVDRTLALHDEDLVMGKNIKSLLNQLDTAENI